MSENTTALKKQSAEEPSSQSQKCGTMQMTVNVNTTSHVANLEVRVPTDEGAYKVL